VGTSMELSVKDRILLREYGDTTDRKECVASRPARSKVCDEYNTSIASEYLFTSSHIRYNLKYTWRRFEKKKTEGMFTFADSLKIC